MRKKVFLFSLVFVLFTIPACMNDDLNNNINENKEENHETEQQKENENNEDEIAEEGNQTNDEQNTKDQEKKKYVKMTGNYVGQADPHTIEMETDEGPVAYQLSDEARFQVESLEPGDEVVYEFYERGEQLVIERIEKSRGNNLMIETGTYNGQADPHTIEIETPRGTYAFQLTMEVREHVEKLQLGDKVRYYYVEDGDFREINRIEKVEE